MTVGQISENLLTQPVGIVGTGLCGSALVERLVARGVPVVAYDVSGDALAAAVSLGAAAAASAAAAARQARTVVLSLPDSPDVLLAVEGPDGLLSARRPPALIVDTTTGDPGACARLAGRLAARGIGFAEACISGSSEQLRRGEAVLLTGGSDSDLDRAQPLLEVFSRHILRIGPAGSGSKAKLVTNLVLGLNRLVLAEGLAFGRALGLAPETCLEFIRRTPAHSVAADVKGDRMVRRDYRPAARARQHRKDLELILRQLPAGADLPLARVHAAVLDRLIADGGGDLDNAAVFEIMRAYAEGVSS